MKLQLIALLIFPALLCVGCDVAVVYSDIPSVTVDTKMAVDFASRGITDTAIAALDQPPLKEKCPRPFAYAICKLAITQAIDDAFGSLKPEIPLFVVIGDDTFSLPKDVIDQIKTIRVGTKIEQQFVPGSEPECKTRFRAPGRATLDRFYFQLSTDGSFNTPLPAAEIYLANPGVIVPDIDFDAEPQINDLVKANKITLIATLPATPANFNGDQDVQFVPAQKVAASQALLSGTFTLVVLFNPLEFTLRTENNLQFLTRPTGKLTIKPIVNLTAHATLADIGCS